MGVEDRELLVFAELDVDLDGPLVELAAARFAVRTRFGFDLVQTDLPGAANAGKRVSESIADLGNERIQFRLPALPNLLDRIIKFGQAFSVTAEFFLQFLDLLFSSLKYLNDVAVPSDKQPDLGLLGVDIGIEVIKEVPGLVDHVEEVCTVWPLLGFIESLCGPLSHTTTPLTTFSEFVSELLHLLGLLL